MPEQTLSATTILNCLRAAHSGTQPHLGRPRAQSTPSTHCGIKVRPAPQRLQTGTDPTTPMGVDVCVSSGLPFQIESVLQFVAPREGTNVSCGDLAASQFPSRSRSFYHRHIRHPWAACGLVSHRASLPSFHHNLPQLHLMLRCARFIHNADTENNYVRNNYIIRVMASTRKSEKADKLGKLRGLRNKAGEEQRMWPTYLAS
jgi:hypothetical protein